MRLPKLELGPVALVDPVSGTAVGAAGHPDGEGILNQRWWTSAALDAAHGGRVLFSPRDFPRMLRFLLGGGPTHTPTELGRYFG
ncbi:hypothetical protein [Mycolicibacterium sp. YH-1]|uniref:hypothetical protein n=1 Tax=Mycolicibacterium sp. YH-1 TaxID=2908837 RepID=UPI001F4C3A6E|nr:hypothetical protein [Mycolicibacterium sp. YH-1]UNB54577.1 hypothetical protein L0M16_09785 [Mycolicibacterium sp. YH-1]